MNIDKHLRAYEDVKNLVIEGRKYLNKLASIDLTGSFIYWNPETKLFAMPKNQVAYKQALYAAGSLPFTIFDDSCSEKSGWLPLNYPDGSQPLKGLNKYAALIDTPAKMSLAGALIGGSVGGLKSILWDTLDDTDELGEPLTIKARLRKALGSTAIGSGIGMAPGLIVGALHSSDTRPILGTQNNKIVYGKPEIGFWKSMFYNNSQRQLHSPTYAAKQYLANAKMNRVKSGSLSLFSDPKDIQSNVINVDSFNRVIWDDTKAGIIQPDNALLVSSALDASRGRSPYVTPGAVVGTLINAGIGYATAGVIGKTLGAMNMCSPGAQEKLRNMGAWGGMINGIGNAMMH